MNHLALLHPSLRRSVFDPPRAPSEVRDGRTRRPRSKNCRRRQRPPTHETHHALLRLRRPEPIDYYRDVEQLREQVAALDRRLSLLDSVALVARQNAQAAALRMMATYHQLTSRGYDATRDTATTGFMHALFTPDVRSMDYTGIDVFLQQWEQLSRSHASIRVDTASLEVLPTESLPRSSGGDVYVVRTAGTTTLRISRRTLETVFPHVLSDEPLVQWLIGKEYAFSFTVVVHVNAAGKVFQLESRVDLTSALLDLLKDPLVTVKMITATNMTRAGNLLLHNEVREAQNTIENAFL
ncbi:hypothetical protein PybrP1_000513 [[Pythium] brassicae (nom. inval.)]|nr:hypothetical protein PybrP1_000513 [[Pythium] brassicae (nom. inval.)]